MGVPEGKRLLGRSRCRWDDEMNLNRKGRGGVDSSRSGQEQTVAVSLKLQ